MAVVDVELGLGVTKKKVAPAEHLPGCAEDAIPLLVRQPSPSSRPDDANPMCAFGESIEDATDPYRNVVREALQRIAKDAGGIAWIEVWARLSQASETTETNTAGVSVSLTESGRKVVSDDRLHLQTSWMSSSSRMAARPHLVKRLSRPAEPCAPGNGLAGILFASAGEPSLRAPVEWNRLSQLVEDPELPDDDHAEALAEALPGCHVAGVCTRDSSVMLLVVTMPPDADDERAPRWVKVINQPPPLQKKKPLIVPMLRRLRFPSV